MSSLSVLYDAPGPRAKRRNILYSILFVIAVGLAAWWVLDTMASKSQLDSVKWKPFVTDSRVWTEFLIPV